MPDQGTILLNEQQNNSHIATVDLGATEARNDGESQRLRESHKSTSLANTTGILPLVLNNHLTFFIR